MRDQQIPDDLQANHDAEGFPIIESTRMKLACDAFFISRNMPLKMDFRTVTDRRFKAASKKKAKAKKSTQT